MMTALVIWATGLIIALAVLRHGTKIMIEARRERRRERRCREWSRMSDTLPEGSRLIGIEPDSQLQVEIGQVINIAQEKP